MANIISVKIPSSGAPVITQPVNPGGTVKFTNSANAAVTVNFGNKTPFCPQKLVFNVPANATASKDVCTTYMVSGIYGFSTTVTGAAAQSARLEVMAAPNPIVFPEKQPIVFPEDWVALALGIGIGLLVGFLIGRRQPVRTAQR